MPPASHFVSHAASHPSGPPRELPGSAAAPSLPVARDYCRRLAHEHYENFTVVSWLAPQKLRQHLANVYAFCRKADDLADETADPGQALQLLENWEEQLLDCYAGRATHPVFVALAETVAEYEIPPEPFRNLLAAFRQDQRKSRYETFDELRDYCRGSADPVGRIVLHLGRCHNADTVPLSDAICTGLQLANFCQDVARDYAKGRVYLPQESFRQFQCAESQLSERPAGPAFRHLLASEVERAEAFLHQGQPLARLVSAELRASVELFTAGGLAILAAVRRDDYDVLSRRPTVGRLKKTQLLLAAAARRLLPSGGAP